MRLQAGRENKLKVAAISDIKICLVVHLWQKNSSEVFEAPLPVTSNSGVSYRAKPTVPLHRDPSRAAPNEICLLYRGITHLNERARWGPENV